MITPGKPTREAAEESAARARRQLGQGWRVTVHETPGLWAPFIITCDPVDDYPTAATARYPYRTHRSVADLDAQAVEASHDNRA